MYRSGYAYLSQDCLKKGGEIPSGVIIGKNTTLAKTATFLNRAAAGILTAALTGTLLGVAFECYDLVTSKAPGSGAEFLYGTIWMVGLATVFGAFFGSPSGILVMCLSRAKSAPWRSVPILLTGTSAGFVTLALPWAFFPGQNANATILYVMCIVGPTVGGVVASGFIRRAKSDPAS